MFIYCRKIFAYFVQKYIRVYTWETNKMVTPHVRKTELDVRIGWFIGLVSSLMAGQKPAG